MGADDGHSPGASGRTCAKSAGCLPPHPALDVLAATITDQQLRRLVEQEYLVLDGNIYKSAYALYPWSVARAWQASGLACAGAIGP